MFVALRGPRTAGDDPWDANTLEWATTSPPPSYNFDRLPEIRSERPLFDLRHGRTHAGAVLPVPTDPSATTPSATVVVDGPAPEPASEPAPRPASARRTRKQP
jgi:heme/copper-type cytochrome/quinol oxidase subunit 1